MRAKIAFASDIRKDSKNVCEKSERFHARFSYQKKRITNEKFEKKERGIWKKKKSYCNYCDKIWEIKIELYPKEAPNTVNCFISLAKKDCLITGRLEESHGICIAAELF